MKRFKFPIRTTPEGSIDPYGGKPMPKHGRHRQARLLHAAACMGGYRAGKPEELIRRK